MFSGIIDHTGTIQSVVDKKHSKTFVIETKFDAFVLGESISVDGTCLTVTEFDNNIFQCDVSSETLKLTLSQFYQTNSQVNLERSLRIGDRLGGHFVTGHVDQMARLKEVERMGEFVRYVFDGIVPENARFLSKKGSISVNGVSLTVNEVRKSEFEVMLIPHTLERTNLSMLKEGSPVNIEFDLLARHVWNLIRS